MKKLSMAAIVAAFFLSVAPVMVGTATPAYAGHMGDHQYSDCPLLWPFDLLADIFGG